jgi:hypothetical protein
MNYVDCTFAEQITTAGEIKNARSVWQKNRPGEMHRVIIASATQSGKTEMIHALLDSIRKGDAAIDEVACKENPSPDVIYQVPLVVFFGHPSKDLGDQTFKDLCSWKYAYWCKHGDGLEFQNKITSATGTGSDERLMEYVEKARKESQRIIWILDEADWGSGGEFKDETTREFVLTIRNFCVKNKIPLFDVDPPKGREKFEHAYMITATLAHLMDVYKATESDTGNKLYELFTFALGNDNDYAGVDTLMLGGYLLDNTNFSKTKSVSTHQAAANVNQALFDAIKNDIRLEDPGYHVVRRATGKAALKIELHRAFVDIDVQEINCSRGNISRLKSITEVCPLRPTVLFIEEAAKRGIRIKPDYIHTWISKIGEKNDAAVLQDIGRMTGRNKFCKYHKRLKIYCCLATILKEIPAIKAQRNGSASDLCDYLVTQHPGQTGTHCRLVPECWELTEIKTFNSKPDVDNWMKNNSSVAKTLSASTISGNDKIDVAAEFKSRRFHYEYNGDQGYQLIHADGPSLTYPTSWDTFQHKHKFVLCIFIRKVNSIKSNANMHS